MPGEVEDVGDGRTANRWAIAGGAVGLWLGLQVIMAATGSFMLSNVVILATTGLLAGLGFAIRMGRLTEARWGIVLAVVALFAARSPWVTELCLVGYFVWAGCWLAREEAEGSAGMGEAGEEMAGAGAADRFFLDVRLWSLLLWWLLSRGIAWEAGWWWSGLTGPAQTGDKLSGITFQYVFYGLLLFWLLQKVERGGLDIGEFIGCRPGIRFAGEGVLVALAASLSGIAVTDGLLYAAASFDAGFTEGVLKNWVPPTVPNDWQLERFLSTVIFAPTVEELVFRGLVLRRLAARWGGTAAVIVSSAAFGGLHGSMVVSATIFGVAMAVLYVRSQTLAVPIAAHMVNNLAAFSLRWYQPENDTVTLALFYEGIGQEMLALGLLAPIVGYYCYRNWPRRRDAWPLVSAAGAKGKV